MKWFKICIICFGLAATITGCKKFLDENSQSLQYADNWQRLQEVLVGDGYMPHLLPPFPANSYKEQQKASYMSWLNMMDDDIAESVTGLAYFDGRQDYFGMFTWQANPFVSYNYGFNNDDSWSKFYVNINAVNVIAQKAADLKDNPRELKRIRGEALFLRAEYYFYMVNTYALAYNKKTATTDPGVPLKITEYIEDKFFTRSTVDSVYQQMITDLKEAEGLLDGVQQTSIYHADVNAVNILQIRVYLYMQDWQNAAAAADKVIARRAQLFNLAQYKPATSFFNSASPEAIFTQGGNSMIFTSPLLQQLKVLMPSPDLMSLYQPGDLRVNAFFEQGSNGIYRYTKVYRSNTVIPVEILSDTYFMRNAEAYLNKAEAAAMLDQPADANAALNTLRAARFLPADFTPVNLSGVPLVNFIRDERRRELCFEGHRWFDLKRYAVNEKYPFTKKIVHTWSDGVVGGSVIRATLTLEPGDPDYLLPIPPPAILFNQGTLAPNPARQDRTF